MILKMLILTILIFFKQISWSQTMLVPAQGVDFKTYQSKCHATPYQCTFEYFLNETVQAPTPQFDNFLDQIDYSSLKVTKDLILKILKILENEAISIDQVDQFLRLIENYKNLSTENNQLKLIEDDLKKIKTILEKNYEYSNDNFFIVFKKPIPMSILSQFKKNFLNFPVIHVQFNYYPSRVQMRSLANEKPISLLTGSCENIKMTEALLFENWLAFENKTCSWSKKMSELTTNTTDLIKNNYPLITGVALAIGAGLILSNQYEVSFQF